MEFELKIDAGGFRDSVNATADRYEAALDVAKNMIASMMLGAVKADIAQAGNFGEKYLSALTVTVDGDTITTKIDAPGADIFETGGTINGNPLLWLPISGTDAVGIQASEYGDKLFSVNRKTGGVPLLFSVKDKAPKYFGVPSVNIPKKFHISEIQDHVMESFPQILEDALNE